MSAASPQDRLRAATLQAHRERIGRVAQHLREQLDEPIDSAAVTKLARSTSVKCRLTILQGWAENEQKCCAQLKIDSQIVETGKRALVRVVCDEGLKTELMQIFGLKAGE